MLKAAAPALWDEVAGHPCKLDTNGLSMRTRNKLQERGMCTAEQLFKNTRDQAVEALGEQTVKEIDAANLGRWKSE